MSEGAAQPGPDATDATGGLPERHGGELAVSILAKHGVDTMFTLSGGHVFPLYDGAVRADPPMRLVDVRHEQSAVFAAEATAKLTRRPGLAVLTAGPGVTNAVSAVTTAHLNSSPVLVLGGRAPAGRWGAGSLQELDHPPILRPVTKYAGTITELRDLPAQVDHALRLATTPRRGPVFLDVPMDQLFDRAAVPIPEPVVVPPMPPDPDALDRVAILLRNSRHPVLVLGSDVWAGRADNAARRFAETVGLPVIANGMGRGIVPAGSPLVISGARAVALAGADLVLVAGTPLDFRLGFGAFGGRDGAAAAVVHLVETPSQVAEHVPLAGSVAGDLTLSFDGLLAAVQDQGGPADLASWLDRLRAVEAARAAEDADLLAADTEPIHPARVYGELRRVLNPDAVVIGDGGDFVSYAGKYVESRQAGCWLDPGPYGCLGTGLGYAIAARLARPSAQVVLLLGDGAAGFSLLDVDTLVRHRLPVVMICGNNGGWGLEKHLMHSLYGYDVAADLQPQCRYDEVVRALGGAGELVTKPADIGPGLRRAFAADVPYLVNVAIDPEVAYPRTANLA
jgi:acetolactate synthase-1/2/3 large subunit